MRSGPRGPGLFLPAAYGRVVDILDSYVHGGITSVVRDAPAASKARDAFEAMARGDTPGISCVIIDGHVRTGRSRNSPLAKRLAAFKGVSVPRAGH